MLQAVLIETLRASPANGTEAEIRHDRSNDELIVARSTPSMHADDPAIRVNRHDSATGTW
jgi:hypothetical protein